MLVEDAGGGVPPERGVRGITPEKMFSISDPRTCILKYTLLHNNDFSI